MFRESHARDVVAAGYDSGVRIVAHKPVVAAEGVLAQIADRTGLQLHYSIDSRLEAMQPAVMVQGFSDTAVVTVVLTPASGDEFTVSCAYVIDARTKGAIDGTPAAIDQMQREKVELKRLMNDDSIADVLPDTIGADQIEDRSFGRRFFKGLARTYDVRNGSPVPIAILMLKRKDVYTIGYYEKSADHWALIDQPVVVSGTKPPYFTNLPNQNRGAVRGNKLDQSGSVFVYLENGHVTRRDM